MKINKIVFLILLVFMITIKAPDCHAFFTLDTKKGVGKIFNNISNYSKRVQEKIADLQSQIMGKKWVQDGISAAKYVKATYNANIATLREYQRIYNNFANSDAVQMARLGAEISSLERTIEDLESQKAQISNNYQAQTQADVALIDGKIKVLTENNALYAASDEENKDSVIEENNAQISALEEQKTQIQDQTQDKITNAQESLDSEIERLESMKESLEEQLKSKASWLAADFINDVQLLTMSQDLNFIAENQEYTTKAIETIKDNRNRERNSVAMDVYAGAISAKPALGSKIANTSSFTKFSNGFEEVSSNILSLTETKIAQIEDLIVYVELMILDLKMQTAQELAQLNHYTYNLENKNVEIFDLGDYQFDYDEYKEQRMKNQPLSINTILRNAQNVENAKNNIEHDISGGLIEEGKDFIDYIKDPSNAGSYGGGNDKLEQLEYDIDNTQNRLDQTLEESMNLL